MMGIKGGAKRGHIVADTLLLMVFSWASTRGNICESNPTLYHRECVETKKIAFLFKGVKG